jgi:hypothetical protein
MAQSSKGYLFDAGAGDAERLAPEALRAAARSPEESSSVGDDGVVEKELAWSDAIGAWVCWIGVAAAVLLVLVLAAGS